MPEASSIVAAIAWVEGLLFGSMATVIAILVVAGFGFMMFRGSIDWRRGARIVVGCFILFGAHSLAAGLMGAARSSAGMEEGRVVPTGTPTTATVLPYEPSRPPQSVCWTCGTD